MPVTGWDLYSTLQEQAAYAEYYASIPPVACPNDGTQLKEGPSSEPGILFCPFDGWQYPRDYDVNTMSGI
jgi:hypothetical protein